MDYTSFSDWQLRNTFPGAISTKKKALTLMTLLCSAMLVPLAIKNYFVGHYAAGSMMLLFIAALCIDLLFILKEREPPVNARYVVATSALAALLTVYQLGDSSVYWVFAALPAFAYVLPRNEGRIASGLTIIATAAVVMHQVALSETLRIVASLVFIAVICDMALAATQAIYRKSNHNASFDDHCGGYGQRMFETLSSDAFHLKKRDKTSSTLAIIRYEGAEKLSPRAQQKLQRQLAYHITDNIRGHDFLFSLRDNEFLILSRFCSSTECEQITERLTRLLLPLKLTVQTGASTIDQVLNAEQWLAKTREQLPKTDAIA